MTEIPVIDFTPVHSRDHNDWGMVVAEVDAACRDIGFFAIANPPISPGLIEAVYAQAQAFYALPEAEKMKCYIGAQPNHRGYAPVGEEEYGEAQGASGAAHAAAAPKELKEGFEVGNDTGAQDPDYLNGALFLGPNVWPEGLPEFRPTIEQYYQEVSALGGTLFQIFAQALSVDVELFQAMTRKPASNLRLLHYHAREILPGETALGIGVHTDSECFTLLSTRGSGLQAVSREGKWINAPEVAGGFIVNIGDTMEAWTNGTYVSTQHRVVSDGRERWSLPFFVAADYFQEIRPLPQFVTQDEPARYKPFISGVHILSEYAKGYRYLKAMAAAGELALESAPDEVSQFSKSAE